METILYKPLFINPQAYYVFPNINGRLEPKTGSGKEPAMFIGNIEVKTIAHGDIGKKQYFYNTNEIDLSAFSNSLVRISLYTNRGNVVLGEWDLDIIEEESENYIDPEILDSLCGVWIADQNTNESESRNIIKNKIADRGGDLELLNFAYKANSGYNGYPEDFTSWNYNTGLIVSPTKVQNNGDAGRQLIYYHTSIRKEDVLEFKVKITLDEQSKIKYWYIKEDGTGTNITCSESGTYTIPTSYFSKYTGENTWFGFEQLSGGCIIEQLPLYEGALVTDGKDDMIVSQKTVQEMLGGSNEVTVVSMIHQIGLSSLTTINNIRSESVAHVACRNICSSAGKTGVYGYSKQINTNNPPTLINNILGDKKDYTAEGNSSLDPTDKFFVQGYKYRGSISEVSQIAYYWTFVSNKVLTTDQINQVISYFNLDKHVKPDVYYDVKKQGLSNDTPEADWYLKDFSGNGHDMTLYNFVKKLGSGIGKYEVDFNTWIPQSYVADSTYTSNKLHITNIKVGNAILYTRAGANAMKVKITGIQSFNLVYRYIAENDVWKALEVDRDGIYELPASTTTTKTYYTGFAVPYYTGNCDITIEQIPDYEGALVSDGIGDYGKVENLPIYKDYTVVADREIIDGLAENADGGVAVRGTSISNGAFGFDYKNEVYSFATPNSKVIDVERFISYQSKYVNNGTNINAGNIVDANPLTIGKLGSSTDRYSKLALWSFLLFPYTLSEFLLERQLKRYKLGTLYPDMVEFRPIVKSNSEYQVIDYYIDNLPAVVGKYYPIDSNLRIAVVTKGVVDEVSSLIINGVSFGTPNVVNNRFTFNGTLSSKSPQKIDITIDEYIRYEDIVQPYPAIINLKQDGKTITWGDKLKVGSDIVFVGSANLLPELYTVSETRYNGVTLYPNTIIKVEKSMVFDNARTYLKANEPSCILSPNRLRIPNSSYKILGYIPDLTGKGNHGRLNNFAYTEESGANEDGSIRFDGTDDYITIPTLSHGGKQVLMKVNLQRYDKYLYDQRNSWSQYLAIVSAGKTIAYECSNKGGKTYIDGILNEHIIDKDLLNITHNITATNANIGVQYAPNIGTSFARGNFAQMALFDFMLFPEISSEEEIQELNDIVGIEGGYVERPEYYWDAYGKTNSDADRATIIDQVSKDPANALTANNFAFNEESGYVDNGLVSDGVDDNLKNTNMPVLTDYTWIMKRERLDDRNSVMAYKGDSEGWGAFAFELLENAQCTRSFSASNNAVEFPSLISYQTKTNYNGKNINAGIEPDGNTLYIFRSRNAFPYYCRAVFYKAMLYSKTIDTLSINMLKNLFDKDELIDVNNPIFKKQ